jgi:hypothetical protein
MKCPTDGTKISTKHYDPDFEWYECPKCEGCFTADELEEAENGTSPRKRAKDALKKQKGKKQKDVPVAKAKKRKTEILADEELADRQLEEMSQVVKTDAPVEKKHRDELPTKQIVNIMADEIQNVYEEMGGSIDDLNAREKALIIWRQLRIDTGISAREQDVEYVACDTHS